MNCGRLLRRNEMRTPAFGCRAEPKREETSLHGSDLSIGTVVAVGLRWWRRSGRVTEQEGIPDCAQRREKGGEKGIDAMAGVDSGGLWRLRRSVAMESSGGDGGLGRLLVSSAEGEGESPRLLVFFEVLE
ncbi:hypothetical protein V8G54_001099 [Vigna mungo]|uniref:Uncharacterized protein n=1 Tax=Vigna mungo TaxID=3915 RepID=A0AAQ3P7L4_VIGMU